MVTAAVIDGMLDAVVGVEPGAVDSGRSRI